MFEVRRINLRKLVLDKFEGNRAAYSRAAEVHQNQVNLLLTDNPKHLRNLGEALARKMEGSLLLPNGYLDQDHSGEAEFSFEIKATVIPENLSSILQRDDFMMSGVFWGSQGRMLAQRCTGVQNLIIACISTDDMAPTLNSGDRVIIDCGVKAISVDGVYVIARGEALFLRRVTKQITGGWVISGAGEQITVDSLRGYKPVAKVVLHARLTFA